MKRISSFLNSNSVAIQAFSVIFLVIVTLFYAIRTHSMAEVMKRDFELKTQPFLALDMAIGRGFGEVDNKSIQLAFTLKNVGLVPLIYSNDEMEIKGVSINPKRVAITLFPTQTLTLFSNLTVVPGLNDSGVNEQGKIKLVFWTQSNPEKKYSITRYFTLASQNGAFVDKEEFDELK